MKPNDAGKYRVRIRHDLAEVKPEARELDGKTFIFSFGWVITSDDSSLYAGELAMIPEDSAYPIDAPAWIASGDLEPVSDEPKEQTMNPRPFQ